jgi:hypothetical protein
MQQTLQRQVSLTAPSANGNSLSSDLLYTPDLNQDASSKAFAQASNNHQLGIDTTANNTLDKKSAFPSTPMIPMIV